MDHVKSRFGLRVIRLLYAVLGVGVGAVGATVVTGQADVALGRSPARASTQHDSEQVAASEECVQALAAAKNNVAMLEQRLASLSTTPPRSNDHSAHGNSSPTSDEGVGEEQQNKEAQAAESLKWKISAIEKFVPLTDDQKERLRAKYEADAAQRDGEAKTERLEDIIGEENATFYRQQVKAAFQKVQDEEVEKEVVWLSRSLQLTQEQEQAVSSLFREVEQQIDQENGAASHGGAGSPQDRVKAMIAENKKRAELRAARLKDALTAEQYEAYLKAEAASSSADVEVFHDPQ